MQGKKRAFKVNFCGDEGGLLETKGHQEECRMRLLGSHRTAHLDIPYSYSIFHNF